MADHTQIEWADATWNPINGCSVTSPGCTNCYAMRLAIPWQPGPAAWAARATHWCGGAR